MTPPVSMQPSGEGQPESSAAGSPAGSAARADDARQPSVDVRELRRVRKSQRLTQAELAELLGIHRTYMVLIEKGKKVPSPRLERVILEFMARAGKEDISTTSLWNQAVAPRRPAAPKAESRKAPVVSWGSAGSARDYEDLANQMEEFVETDCKDPNAFAIILEGDSMEEKFYAGDRVVFAPNLEPRNGDAVVAKLADGRVLFKYFYRTGPEGARIRLVSANPNYSPLEFEQPELAFVYPAWEVKRRLRR